MTQRASESLVAVLIRIGLLLALVIMLMAENAQAQAPFSSRRVIPGRATLQACSRETQRPEALAPIGRRSRRRPRS